MAIDINNLNSGASTRTDSRSKAKADTGSNSASQTGNTSAGVSRDSVQLTDTAEKMRQLEQNLADLPVTNEDRVAAVKRAISEGSYEINTLSIANKMLNFERSLG